jgi:hypothetical protein
MGQIRDYRNIGCHLVLEYPINFLGIFKMPVANSSGTLISITWHLQFDQVYNVCFNINACDSALSAVKGNLLM